MIEVDARARWRELMLVSGRKAFGDASISDAISGSRRFYVLRLGKFNVPGRHISE